MISVQPPAVAEEVSSELRDGVLHVRLNRPQRLNALIRPMLDALETLVRWAELEPAVRCLLLSAEGRAFSVGDDLNGLGGALGIEQSDRTECYDSYPRVVSALLRLRKPAVAAVHGALYGGAMEIALACDLRVGDETTRFGPVYTEHAFVAGTTLLPMYVGVPRARRILMLAEPIPAPEALQLGLIDQLVDKGEALPAAQKLAGRLAAGPTHAYGLLKSALLTGVGRGLLENLHTEEDISLEAMKSEDAQEGLRAFQEKRAPVFKGA
jgi:enoyl-CoA hydratase/carnithine racemase